MTQPYDVLIAGGGLAGLCLARQLTREAPSLRVFLAEKRAHPVPEAAFKVGESSVEIGAHYFQRVLGLEPHLRAAAAREARPAIFLSGRRKPAGRGALRARALRLSAGAVVPARPRAHREHAAARRTGTRASTCATIAASTGFEFGASLHRLEIQSAGRTEIVEGRWLVDASGRRGLIRHRLGLTRPVGHLANACWFRFPHRLQIDDWSADPPWKARVPSGERWLSTNHLMGVGYWVWLIPLGSGSTSVGIVVDATLHPLQPSESIRPRARLAPRIRAAVRRRRGVARGGPRGLSRAARIRLRLQPGVLAGPVGAHRRSGPLHRSVLFPGLRLHRHGERLRRRPDSPGARRRRRVGAGRAVQHDVPAAVRRLPARVRGAVPDHGERAGDDRESRLGQCLLLGDHGPAVLPAEVPRSRSSSRRSRT